jgi:WD40 repeat protein
MSRCPSLEQLEQLLEEQLDDAEQRAVSQHIGNCDLCQETLEHLTEGGADEALLSSLRVPIPAEISGSAASAATSFLAHLKHARPGRSPAGSDHPHPELSTSQPPAVDGYEILKELGRGGMGVVYQARHLGLNRPVALKMILAGSHAGPKDLARFRQEAEAVARMRHPNIVQIYDIGEASGWPFFALEFVEGGSLVQHLRGDPQPIPSALRLVETLARAIHCAHQQGIVHRDLKPANVLLSFGRDPEGSARLDGLPAGSRLNECSPKVTDFGLAKRLDERPSGPHTAEVVGTPSYMAPEQAAGPVHAVGPAADVYALGAILYEMLTGRPPFKGATPVDTVVQVIHEEPVRPARLRPDLPRDLETICLKCLEKDPRKRYTSAAALADDVRRFRQGKPIRARAVGPVERAWKWARRRPLTAALLVGMLLSVVAGFTGVTWQWREAADARDTALAEKAEKETERAKADRARIDAEKARQRAGQDRRRARTALYFSRIAQSQLQWRVNDLVGAERSLTKCIPATGQVDRRNWEWYYLHGLFHSDLFTTRHAQGGLAACVAYAPNGQWLASLVGGYAAHEHHMPGEVRIWNAASGALIRTLPGPGTLQCLAVAPASDRLALAGSDGALRIWEARTGRELLCRFPHRQAIAAVAFSPDGQTLATASWDRTLKITDWSTGEVLHVLKGHAERVQAVAFHPSGDRLASGDWNGAIRIWSKSGRLQGTWEKHKSAVFSVAFSPDGQLLVSAGSNGNLKIWEVASGKVVQSLTGHAGAVVSAVFSPDGRAVAYSGGDATARVWDIENGLERVLFRGHASPVDGVHFSPDGQRLASVSSLRGSVKVWDLTHHPEHATFARAGPADMGRAGPDVEALAFHADGKHIVSIALGGKLQTWDAVTGVLQDERRLALYDQLVSPAVLAAFAPGAHRLAGRAREDARLVKAWDTATGAETAVFRGHALPISCLRFSGDGKVLVTGACDLSRATHAHEIKIWDAATGRLLAELAGRGPIYNTVFHPDGRRLALAGHDGRLTVIDWSHPDKPISLEGHNGEVTAIAFSADGRFLASSGYRDRTIKIWDLSVLSSGAGTSRKPVHTLPAPLFLGDLAFSRDGRRLAAINPDLVRLWDTEGGQEVLTLRGAPQRHWDPPFNPRLLFSPDGNRLVGTNWDESISIWDAEPQTDDQLVAQRQETRRRAADSRARFWHLQEAEICLEHKNRPAALFHFQRLASAPIPEPLQARRNRLAELLANGK